LTPWFSVLTRASPGVIGVQTPEVIRQKTADSPAPEAATETPKQVTACRAGLAASGMSPAGVLAESTEESCFPPADDEGRGQIRFLLASVKGFRSASTIMPFIGHIAAHGSINRWAAANNKRI
jgi:hypothetical protein